jgi:hypothetical protein
MYFVGLILFQILRDCDGRMANAIGTGVNVPDFRQLPITVYLNKA